MRRREGRPFLCAQAPRPPPMDAPRTPGPAFVAPGNGGRHPAPPQLQPRPGAPDDFQRPATGTRCQWLAVGAVWGVLVLQAAAVLRTPAPAHLRVARGRVPGPVTAAPPITATGSGAPVSGLRGPRPLHRPPCTAPAAVDTRIPDSAGHGRAHEAQSAPWPATALLAVVAVPVLLLLRRVRARPPPRRLSGRPLWAPPPALPTDGGVALLAAGGRKGGAHREPRGRRRRSDSRPSGRGRARSPPSTTAVVAGGAASLPSWAEVSAAGLAWAAPRAPRAEDVPLVFYRDSNSWCPYCMRVWFALEERGMPRLGPLSAGRMGRPWGSGWGRDKGRGEHAYARGTPFEPHGTGPRRPGSSTTCFLDPNQWPRVQTLGNPPPPLHSVNGTGNSPVSGTADPRSSQRGQVIRGLR